MATNATVVTAYKDSTNAYLAVRVDADGGVEYVGRTPLLDSQGVAKTVAQLKTELVAACKAARDAQLRPALVAVAITGSVTL